jgi:ribonuclease HI
MGNKAEVFDAEKWALTKCLAWVINHTTDNPNTQINTINIYIDNAAVVKAVYDIAPTSGQWMGKIIRKNIDKWLEEKEGRKIKIEWIPAHTGIKGNEEADKLAKKGCSKADTFNKITRAFALRTNKEQNLLDWKDRWLDTVGKGRFAWANRRPPAWKPPPHFTNRHTERYTFGRLMQARLGHAHIGEYYKKFNIPEEHSCPCGEPIQTREHVLTECPIHDEHRHILLDDELNIIPTDLFGTKEGITRFTEFLNKTAAFARLTHD